MKLFFTHRLAKDNSFTLVEALFTISILGLVMLAMTPFIRTVYNTWNVGSRRTEMQQNARAGLETMLRLVRQAKRITALPATGSGDFIKFRDTQDNQTIIFYHNVPASTYYIGNTGLIRENDLVMRTIDTNGTTNALLAKSLNNFSIDFKDRAGQLVTQPYNVHSLDVSMSLSDPEGLISDILEVFSSISLRTEVRIDRLVWVGSANFMTELSTDNWITAFSNAYSVSVNSTDGSCWVADTGNNRIKRLDSNGVILVNLTGFNQPRSVSVNPATAECWVADTNNNRIKKLSSTGALLVNVTGFNRPTSVSVNSSLSTDAGVCWVADTLNNRIKKLSPVGAILVNRSGFNRPQSVSVNPSTAECWVADTNNNRIKKLSSTGAVLANVTGFNRPTSVSVNSSLSTDAGVCWVADTLNNRIKKLSPVGSTLLTITGFLNPQFVWVNSAEGSCWVADTGNNQVVKLDAEGNEEFRISGFQSPLSVGGQP